MSKKVLMTESEIRNIIIEEIGYDNYLQLEVKGDWGIGRITQGISSVGKSIKSFFKGKKDDISVDDLPAHVGRTDNIAFRTAPTATAAANDLL